MSGENLRVALEAAAAGTFIFPAIVTCNEATMGQRCHQARRGSACAELASRGCPRPKEH
jgi:hypothetical protein